MMNAVLLFLVQKTGKFFTVFLFHSVKAEGLTVRRCRRVSKYHPKHFLLPTSHELQLHVVYGKAILTDKKKNTFYQQVVKLDANEASARGLQNAR
jgi:ABC-type microcin C transport system permease subunit YejB